MNVIQSLGHLPELWIQTVFDTRPQVCVLSIGHVNRTKGLKKHHE